MDKTTHPIEPKEIALGIKEKPSSVRVVLSRLYRKALVAKEGTNYLIPRKGYEKELEKRLMLNGQKESLPLLHDIHLLFKMENIKKFSKDAERVSELYHNISYELKDIPPDGQSLQNLHIDSNQTIPWVSEQSLTYIHDIFNPFHPDGIYQQWSPIKKNTRKLSGGIQETFDFKQWKLIIQLYGTGTIKIIFSNSEHPFDAQGFNTALQALEGIFQSRTNILFSDIQSLFYLDMVHINSDILGQTELSGASKINCTVQQLDGWLSRVYEKVLGDEVYIRNEMCMTQGSYEDTNLNGVLALLQGGVQPSIVNAQIYQGSRERETLTNANIANSRNITQLQKMIQAHIERQERINEQMMEAISLMTQAIKGGGE